jgi:hypothetical protein
MNTTSIANVTFGGAFFLSNFAVFLFFFLCLVYLFAIIYHRGVSKENLKELQAIGKEILEKGELMFPDELNIPNGHGVLL